MKFNYSQNIAFETNADPVQAAQFYQEVFGMKKTGETDSHIALECDAMNFYVEKTPKPEAGKTYFEFWVDDIDEAKRLLEAKGCTARRSGLSNAYMFTDPFGICWHVYQPKKQEVPVAKGFGGVFLKAKDPEKLYAWYTSHFGIKRPDTSAMIFEWLESCGQKALTVFSIFKQDTEYFGKGGKDVMLNFRVDNLGDMLNKLKSEGVEIDPKTEESEWGKFAWVTDPEGHRIELWEPPRNMPG